LFCKKSERGAAASHFTPDLIQSGGVSGNLEAQVENIPIKCLNRFYRAWHFDTQRHEYRKREHREKKEQIDGKIAPQFLFDHARQVDCSNCGKPDKDHQKPHDFTSETLFTLLRQATSRETAGRRNSKVSEKKGAVLAPQFMFSITDSNTKSE